MKTTTTAHPLEFAFAAETFNLSGEILPAAEPTQAGQLPDTTEPAAELLPEPTKPAASDTRAPLFLDTFGEYIAATFHDIGAGPFPYRYALREILTGRQVAGGYEASPSAARAAADDMARAFEASNRPAPRASIYGHTPTHEMAGADL